MALPPAIETAKQQFAVKHNMNPLEPRTLEAFFTHHVLLHRNLSDFAAEQSWRQEKMILVGGSQDAQLDAIVILANNEEVLRPGDKLDELEQAVANDEPVQISFIFVQATGANLDPGVLTHKMSAFSDGVYAFLDSSPSISEGMNSSLARWIDLKKQIFAILEDGDREGCCDCSMYFVSPKKLLKDKDITRTIETAKSKVLKHKDLSPFFYAVDFVNMGADQLERMIAESSERRTLFTIAGDRFIQAPMTENVDACYFGYLTADEVLGLISEAVDEEENALRQGVFASNVRGYLGTGAAVNDVIAETLRSPKERRQFGLRSNGLAIVAKSHQSLPDGRIRFAGVQIVNGCQTSHTIYGNRAHLKGKAGQEVWLPTKIIVTDDKRTEDAAILGLNRQTPVEATHVFTEKDFVDRLAHEFANGKHASKTSILLEKREGEFKGRDDIEPNQIMTLYDIAQAYAAAFLEKPEHVAGAGKLPIIEKIRDGVIFGKTENVTPYCLSGVMLYRAREAVKRIHTKKRWHQYPMKNMLLYAMRVLAERKDGLSGRPDAPNPEADEAYFDTLDKTFLDPKDASKIAEDATQIIIASLAAKKMKMDSKSARSPLLSAEIAARAAKKMSRSVFGFMQKT